jgi:hypothetical protein
VNKADNVIHLFWFFFFSIYLNNTVHHGSNNNIENDINMFAPDISSFPLEVAAQILNEPYQGYERVELTCQIRGRVSASSDWANKQSV